MLKWDQHCHSLFAVKTVTRCMNSRKFRDPHDPYKYKPVPLKTKEILNVEPQCQQWHAKDMEGTTSLIKSMMFTFGVDMNH